MVENSVLDEISTCVPQVCTKCMGQMRIIINHPQRSGEIFCEKCDIKERVPYKQLIRRSPENAYARAKTQYKKEWG